MHKGIKTKIGKAPHTPGVYFFRDIKKRIIYIGKAANLHARLRSYLRPGWKERMIEEAVSVSWHVLASDIEALIRESELIKTNRPKYNIVFRDDKNYFYVEITGDQFPRLFITHQPTHIKHSVFVGPFTDGAAIKRVVRFLRNAFPYCTCSSRVPHKRPCINGELGRCLGFCCTVGTKNKNDILLYRKNITLVKQILSGKARTLATRLKKDMSNYAKRREYERARVIRDQLVSLERILKHSPYLKKDISEERYKALEILQHILKLPTIPRRIEGYDISHHQGDSSVASMVVFEEGLPKKNDYRKFIIRSVPGINDPAMIQEVLVRRLKHPGWPRPDFILVDGGRGQLSAARAALHGNQIRFGAIAKREEKLYVEGRRDPFRLTSLPPSLLYLITHIRDESHRFAVSFHRRRRSRLVIPR